MTACKSNLKNIGTALEMYSQDHDRQYPAELSALAPNYLKTIPECPAAGAVTYELQTGPGAPMNIEQDEDYYYLSCKGENHDSVSVPPDYPKYNSVEGLIER